MAERIQKALARAGYGSRRGIEAAIKEGKVTVNGAVAELGDQIGVDDLVKLDGRAVSPKRLWQQPQQVLLYNKPVGEVCTRKDPEGRRTIFQSLPSPEEGRWVSVGRLDINTSGLIILTTDGELANKLMHPSAEMDREYAVRVLGDVTGDMMQNLRDGVELEDGKAKFNDIQPAGGEGANRWFHVVIQEGRNRAVRRMWETQGVQVSRLMRVRYGPIIIPKQLKMGRWMMLESDDIQALYEEVDLVPKEVEKTGRAQREKKMRPLKDTDRKSARPQRSKGSSSKESFSKGTSSSRGRIRGH
ncbi:MAG: 23S rRNA pseudouridylate synthase B [Gammaproteobacteria bacterium]|nr:MAG: 23S rRNA pseudouridylate synthase B [Gammaproteobacteria bacterium]